MKFKYTGTYLVIFSILLFLVTNLIIWTQVTERISIYTENIVELELVRANNRLKEAENRIMGLYATSKKNVLFIKNLVELDIANNVNARLTAERISRFVELDENYFQARYINTIGREIIKIEQSGNTTNIVSSEELKYKGDRDYFKKTLNLGKGEVFVSNLDLNIEDGQIEIPYRPTVRFFTPVFTDNVKMGIVGLNLNIKNWFEVFVGKNIGILNENREVYFDSEESLYGESNLDLTNLDPHGHPSYFSKLISLEGEHYWTLYTRADNDSIDLKLKKFRNDIYLIGLLLSLGLLLFLIIVNTLNQRKRKIMRLNQAIENRLNERDTLIKEIHHRVKNNLQVVASLLSLQSSFIDDERIKAMLRYSQYRINSMGMVHEMLYKSNNLDRIDFGNYIKELVNTLILSMKGRNSKIEVVTDIKDIFLNIDTSIPLGLIINEIITNSLKYGFPHKKTGNLSIKIDKLDAFNYKLIIGDDGAGIPSHINFRNTKSLGLKLIHKLTLQLRGTVEKDNSKEGTFYIITFQEIEQTS